jgi:non-lysosomal glucosylceramidase
MLSFHLHNPTNNTIEASICGTFLNPIGCDGRQRKGAWGSRIQYVGWDHNRNVTVPCPEGNRLHLLSDSTETEHEAWGDMCVTATGGSDAGTRNAWAERSWGDTILDFWDEFSRNGEITPRNADKKPYKLFCSTARKIKLQPGHSAEIRFLITWRFPNRKAWAKEVVGNHYADRFASSIEAADYILANWYDLTNRTVAFVKAVCESPLPASVKEAALFNISTLRTQTCLQTPDGHFFGWEGIHDESAPARVPAPMSGITNRPPPSSLPIWPAACAKSSSCMPPMPRAPCASAQNSRSRSTMPTQTSMPQPTGRWAAS